MVGGAAAMAVAPLACRQLVGIGDDPPQGPPATSTDSGAEGGFTYGQGDCATCVATSCAAQATACAGTPSCAALEGCLSAANGDPTKRAQCGVDHGLGYDGATPAFEACLAGACHDACGLTCGGLAAVFPPATATACEACIVKQECGAVTACATDPGCQAGLRCQFSSRTPDVQQACPPLSPDAGIPLLTAAKNPPIASSCSMECSWGADWSCLGRVDWPLAARGPVTLTADVDNYLTALPVTDATVRVCAVGDTGCSSPIVTGNTDDAGTVTLTGPVFPMRELFYIDVTSPSITELIQFDVAPESALQFRFPATTVPPGELVTVASVAQVTLDQTRGVVDVLMHDCRLAPAPGVTFSIDPAGSSTLVYNKGNIPDPTATATDSQGVAVFFNTEVTPAVLRISVSPPVPGQPPSVLPPIFSRAGVAEIIYAMPPP